MGNEGKGRAEKWKERRRFCVRQGEEAQVTLAYNEEIYNDNHPR